MIRSRYYNDKILMKKNKYKELMFIEIVVTLKKLCNIKSLKGISNDLFLVL